ncbi:MAG: sulfur carrier protein ThiS [Burkholderiales bacterium]
MNLTVNGENHSFEQDLSLAQLLQRLELSQRRLAVERNGTVVPRSDFNRTALCSGDVVEIVFAVGGG